jgi:hypothetical protein
MGYGINLQLHDFSHRFEAHLPYMQFGRGVRNCDEVVVDIIILPSRRLDVVAQFDKELITDYFVLLNYLTAFLQHLLLVFGEATQRAIEVCTQRFQNFPERTKFCV